MIIKKIACFLANRLYKTLELSNGQQEQIKYILEVILTDLSKVFILIQVFNILNLGNTVLFILLYSMPLRVNIGGFHLKNYLNCLLFSTLYCILVYYITNFFRIDFFLLTLLAVLSSIIILLIAPVIPTKRRSVNSMKTQRMKRISLFLLIVYILSFIIKNNPHTRYGIWVIIIQTILLLMAKGVNVYEKKTIKKATSTDMQPASSCGSTNCI